MWVYVGVYAHTHAHTHVGYLVVNPWVGIRHLDGPKNPDRLDLGIYVHHSYMCTKYTRACIS